MQLQILLVVWTNHIQFESQNTFNKNDSCIKV
jgi:hypothetical protein